MNRNETLKVLRTHKATPSERFGVTELALFGAFARDNARDDSDVEILVCFDKPANSDVYFGTQFYLEDLLGNPGRSGNRRGPAGGDTAVRGVGTRQCLTPIGIAELAAVHSGHE